MQIDSLKTIATIVASVVTILGGGYTFFDKLGFHWSRPVLTWSPEHFNISSGPLDEPFRAVVARQKHRDDCEVSGFTVYVRDSSLEMFQVTPSTTNFSGPATNEIDKFAYKFYIREQDYESISTGEAEFMGVINYSCPEGSQRIEYPSDLKFTIYGINQRPD